MTPETLHPATKRRATASRLSPRHLARRNTPAGAFSIDELIRRAIADQPPQLYRGGA